MTTPRSHHDRSRATARLRHWGAAFASSAVGLAFVVTAGVGSAAGALAAGMALGMSCAFLRSGDDRRRDRSVVPHDANDIAVIGALGPLLRHCEDAVVVTDAALHIRYANEAFTSLSGRAIATAADTTIVEAVIHAIADPDEFARSLDALTHDHEADGAGDVTHLGSSARTYTWRSVPLRAADGAVAGRGFVFQDRSQAEELAGLKSDFLSTVTHELRTPLTSVKGSLQLVLGKSTALSAIDAELLNISLKNADRLIRLINDLLDISRLELGKIELTFGRVSTASLLEEAVAGLRAYAGARDIAIECAIDADVPAVLGDRDRLIQVLTNLISNAVKFSPASGRVQVSAAPQDAEVAIAVRDWGIGIPAADQSRLFQRFQRLNHGQSNEPGTGLGLAISKAIVERHGGRITLASREQEGSTFTVSIPAVHDESLPRTTRAEHPTDGRDTPPTILLVDDDRDLAVTLERVWAYRYQLCAVARGVDALDVARRTRPDVVLLDVVLPDLSGYDVLQILRTTSATADIPVIMLTIQPERALATSLGACDVVAKPVDVEQLTRALDTVLRGRSGDVAERRAANH